jgi:hypothetical protein
VVVAADVAAAGALALAGVAEGKAAGVVVESACAAADVGSAVPAVGAAVPDVGTTLGVLGRVVVCVLAPAVGVALWLADDEEAIEVGCGIDSTVVVEVSAVGSPLAMGRFRPRGNSGDVLGASTWADEDSGASSSVEEDSAADVGIGSDPVVGGSVSVLSSSDVSVDGVAGLLRVTPNGGR